MTTLDELCGVIAGLGIPWTNTDWTNKEDVSTPYIVLRKQGADTPGANDATWCVVSEYDIELYTIHRNYNLERTVTDALDDAGLYFSDGGCWTINQEGLTEAVFTVTVREN